jgi:hypothetical protein
MLILAAALILADGAATAFPERVPALMEACLTAAVAAGDVTDTAESYKYICAGETAAGLWKFLEHAKVRPYEQDTPEGRWLSREFPLGGCFKRVPLPDGAPASGGLSCTIWIPRAANDTAVSKPDAQ